MQTSIKYLLYTDLTQSFCGDESLLTFLKQKEMMMLDRQFLSSFQILQPMNSYFSIFAWTFQYFCVHFSIFFCTLFNRDWWMNE